MALIATGALIFTLDPSTPNRELLIYSPVYLTLVLNFIIEPLQVGAIKSITLKDGKIIKKIKAINSSLSSILRQRSLSQDGRSIQLSMQCSEVFQ